MRRVIRRTTRTVTTETWTITWQEDPRSMPEPAHDGAECSDELAQTGPDELIDRPDDSATP